MQTETLKITEADIQAAERIRQMDEAHQDHEQSPQITQPDEISSALIRANVTDALITKIKKGLSIKIDGIDDKAGYKEADEARKYAKSMRVLAEKICKKGREEAVAIQKKWIAKQKEITDQIITVELYLEQEIYKIDQEKSRIKKGKEDAELEWLNGRNDQLRQYDASVPLAVLKDLSQEAFLSMVDEARIRYEKEKEQEALYYAQQLELERKRAEDIRIMKEQHEKLRQDAELADREKRILEEKNAELAAVADKLQKEAEEKEKAANKTAPVSQLPYKPYEKSADDLFNEFMSDLDAGMPQPKMPDPAELLSLHDDIPAQDQISEIHRLAFDESKWSAQMLWAALLIITTEIYTNLTPYEVLDALQKKWDGCLEQKINTN